MCGFNREVRQGKQDGETSKGLARIHFASCKHVTRHPNLIVHSRKPTGKLVASGNCYTTKYTCRHIILSYIHIHGKLSYGVTYSLQVLYL